MVPARPPSTPPRLPPVPAPCPAPPCVLGGGLAQEGTGGCPGLKKELLFVHCVEAGLVLMLSLGP